MINLRKMQAHEFSDFSEYFIEDYGTEIVANYGHSQEHAFDLAKKDLQRSLPEGLDTKNHVVLCIEINGVDKVHVVGYLWHCINKKDATTFIYDFYIFKNHRSKGYGKSAIAALEISLAELAIKQIKLRVAYQNKRALALYQEMGFMITGYNMSKNLI
jgi:ribosomal protein S18 acetylase RimI-like enzyme